MVFRAEIRAKEFRGVAGFSLQLDSRHRLVGRQFEIVGLDHFMRHNNMLADRHDLFSRRACANRI